MKNFTENFLVRKTNTLLAKCETCNNRNTRGGNFISADTNNVDVIFVAQNPGKSHYNQDCKPEDIIPFALHEDKNSYPQFFRFFMFYYKQAFDKIPVFYITNIGKCVTANNKLEDVTMINNCVKKYLVGELKYLLSKNPNAVISTLGAVSRNVFAHNELLQDYNTIDVYHPGYMNRKGKEFVKEQAKTFVEKIKEFKK